jgi:hypothetical protein
MINLLSWGALESGAFLAVLVFERSIFSGYIILLRPMLESRPGKWRDMVSAGNSASTEGRIIIFGARLTFVTSEAFVYKILP